MTSEPSGRLYSAVTKYWPRIAGGLVALAVALEWVISGLTSNSGLEFYVFAWATTTGALWFLFEKAEKALSAESRSKVVALLSASGVHSGIEAIPAQFAALFDRVFGERHVTWRCFQRSSVASICTVWAVAILWIVQNPPPSLRIELVALFMVTLIGLVFNLIPDYLSLLETRYLLGKLKRGAGFGRFLFIDVCATALLGISIYLVVFVVSDGPSEAFSIAWGVVTLTSTLSVFEPSGGGPASYTMPSGLFFYSTFFTSAWLWLYAASVLVSRVLLRMNSGVGFLLRVTDVERQPFRSMGFVSVIIVSGLFALGLPLVLL